MEPISTSSDNSEVEQVIDDGLEKVVQDFNEFRERMSQSSSSGTMKLEDLVDLYINNSGENSYGTSQTTQGHFTTLLEDFNKFESMLPAHQVESAHMQSRNGFNIDREMQDSEMMIKELVKDTSQNDTGSFPASFQTVNVNSHVGAGSSSNRVTYIRYGDLNYHGAAGGIIDSVFGDGSETDFSSVMRFFRTPDEGGMNFWPQVGLNDNANRKTTRRKRVKRKYRGVIETEEETASRMEKTKIKNREAAAKAHANRQAREAYIKTQLSKLRRKNEFLKKLVTFLEGRKRINLRPEPLRRTISGPQIISIMDI
ncbi:hypothetical protein Pfo_013266 [Paulownia fortunei]|nr:hypothetical protein Pfo_013266 [Paulownia fortunei]